MSDAETLSLTCSDDGTSSMESDAHQERHGASSARRTFRVGDHVRKWCTFGPVPFRHHGIVVGVRHESDDDAGAILTIMDFCCDSHFSSSKPSADSGGASPAPTTAEGTTILRMQEESARGWEKVPYSETASGGTLTPNIDVVAVKTRIDFVKIITGFDEGVLVAAAPPPFPAYHLLQSNCECFAVWIVTGRWCSMQGLRGLRGGTGVVSTSVGVAVTASLAEATVSVPATGVWGWLGYTAAAPLATVCPWIIPASMASALAAGYGASKVNDKMLENEWTRITSVLNADFARFQM